MKIIKSLVFLFCLLLTTHAFGKSNDYYQQTLTHILIECNSKCQKQIFEQEIKYLLYEIFERVLEKIRLELLEETGKEGKLINVIY